LVFTESFNVKAEPPFNFDLTAQIFSYGDQLIRNYSEGKFSQVIQLQDKKALVTVSSAGAIEHPELKLKIESNVAFSLSDKKLASETINFILNLDFPLKLFYDEIKNNRVMHSIAQQLYGLKNPSTPTVFEALVYSIVEQQISIKVARTIEERIARKFGDTLLLNKKTYYGFPSAKNIANASIDEIQSCGLSQRKAEYIWGAAKLIVDGKLDLEVFKSQENSDFIISELDAIKGIVVWTAELTMLRGMQKLDALPADDFGIRRVISRYFCDGRAIKAAEAREIAKDWGKWKGLAAFYLIIAEVKGIIV
jgi:DNA-3-methyladenine glycosylase II